MRYHNPTEEVSNPLDQLHAEPFKGFISPQSFRRLFEHGVGRRLEFNHFTSKPSSCQTLIVETTMVLFSMVSRGSKGLRLVSLLNSIPNLSCQLPTCSNTASHRLRLEGSLTFSRPDLWSSTMSRLKSVLQPNWSNLTLPVSLCEVRSIFC